MVDLFVEAKHLDFVIASIYQKLHLMRFKVIEKKPFIQDLFALQEPIYLEERMDISIWGVITFALRSIPYFQMKVS